MAKTILMLFAVILLSSCAGSPAYIYTMSPEKLKQVSTSDLCNTFAVNLQNNEKLESELRNRDLFNDREWSAIKDQKIFIGMSENALICSWGIPNYRGDINTSVGPWGTYKQWVYRSYTGFSANYVYTENGYVTSWQQ